MVRKRKRRKKVVEKVNRRTGRENRGEEEGYREKGRERKTLRICINTCWERMKSSGFSTESTYNVSKRVGNVEIYKKFPYSVLRILIRHFFCCKSCTDCLSLIKYQLIKHTTKLCLYWKDQGLKKWQVSRKFNKCKAVKMKTAGQYNFFLQQLSNRTKNNI